MQSPSEAVKLYKCEVYPSQWQADGVSSFMRIGTPITVDGTLMVRLGHGTIVDANDWHADKASASRAAADKLDDIARKFHAAAAAMRSGEVQP